jgi:hypothetical protein
MSKDAELWFHAVKPLKFVPGDIVSMTTFSHTTCVELGDDHRSNYPNDFYKMCLVIGARIPDIARSEPRWVDEVLVLTVSGRLVFISCWDIEFVNK